MHVGVGDRPTEEEAGVHGHWDGRALDGFRHRRGHLHLEIRFLVLGHAERNVAELLVAARERQVVKAQAGLRGELELAGQGAEGVGRECVAVDLLALVVGNRDAQRIGHGQAKAGIVLFAQRALEIHHLAGPIDGPVGIHVGARVVRIKVAIQPEIPRINAGRPVGQPHGKAGRT